MKIAHLPFCYFPDPVGGTEVYVRALAREQIKRGDDAFIIAPAAQEAAYAHEAIRVYRYAVSSDFEDIAELYASDQSVDTAGFARILDEERPDVLHIHGYTHAVTRRMLAAAHERRIRVVFTYHTPTATCVRGTLMRFGHTECDGALDAARCAACALHSHGLPEFAAKAAVKLPLPMRGTFKTGRLATGLRMRELVQRRHDEIRAFLAGVDHIIAPSEWVLRLLLSLGVARAKITTSRQGTATVEAAAPAQRRSAGPLRLAYMGRIERSKGLDVVFDALKRVHSAQIELHLFGVAQPQDPYNARLHSAAARDPRIVWEQPVPPDQVSAALREYDALLVPSQTFETGPLVVLEAFAAGVPVIGSRLGGIAELVRDGVDGVLVPAGDVNAWQQTIERLANDRSELARLQSNVPAPRSLPQVAQDMERVYRALLAAA